MPSAGSDLEASSIAAFSTIWGDAFVDASNLEQCTKYLNQALRTFGFSSSLELFSDDPASVTKTCNCIYSLLQQRKRDIEFRQSADEQCQRLLSEVARLEVKAEELKSQLQAKEREVATILGTVAEKKGALKDPDEEQQGGNQGYQRMRVGNTDKCQRMKSDDEGLIDTLFHTKSILLYLLSQIDEMARASKVKDSSKLGRKEESFKSLLSDLLSSIEPWFPKLLELVVSLKEPETQVGRKMVSHICSHEKEDEALEVKCPEHTKLDSLVSPSPLVTWRTDVNVDEARQLFLLTPIAFSKDCKHQKFETLDCGTVYTTATESVQMDDESKGLLDGGEMKACVDRDPRFAAAPEGIQQTEPKSKPNICKGNEADLLMTPCLKISPPKSCVMLEPPTQSLAKDKRRFHNSTPYPIGIQYIKDSEDPESSSGKKSGNLAVKGPELVRIRQPSVVTKKDVYSPDWLFSPPKTCVLLDLPNEKSGDGDCVDQSSVANCAFNEPGKGSQSVGHTEDGVMRDCVARTENTPWKKEVDSIVQTNKRAGENTLKRELWIKFEAASTQGHRYDVLEVSRTAKKGFLDMLDEVSCEKENSAQGLG